jgi:hypothetical protein
MGTLEGIWRLVDSRAWDEKTQRVRAPYGVQTIGQMAFSGGRMLAALCSAGGPPGSVPSFLSYGGAYTFDGARLDCAVDVASDLDRIGDQQVREVVLLQDDQMLVRPPPRLYGSKLERHELIWERVWRPD